MLSEQATDTDLPGKRRETSKHTSRYSAWIFKINKMIEQILPEMFTDNVLKKRLLECLFKRSKPTNSVSHQTLDTSGQAFCKLVWPLNGTLEDNRKQKLNML